MKHEPKDLLAQGIAAAKAGQKETARDLLMRAVEQDERNVIAWLWLSGVLESLDDREVCMENILALDPANKVARQGLEWVRQQKASAVYVPPLISESQAQRTTMPLSPAAAILWGPPKEPVPQPKLPVVTVQRPRDDWTKPPSQAEVEALAEFDDEYLCPYCAAPTRPEDKKCRACGGKLWRYSRKLPEGSYWFWILLSFLWMSAVWRVYLFGMQLFARFGALFVEGAIRTPEQFLGVYLGLPTVPPDVAAFMTAKLPPAAFWSFVASVAVQLVLALLIFARWRPIYWIGAGLALIYLVYMLVQVSISFSWPGVIGLGVAVLPVLMLLLIHEDFMVNRERILCAPDRGVRTHSEFYARGREYARQKMWALAAVHFRRAVAGAPTVLAYHLALVNAYIGLERYERARSALREAQRLAPDHPGVQEVSNLLARTETAIAAQG